MDDADSQFGVETVRIKTATDSKLFRDVDDVYEVIDPSQLSLQERVDWYLNEPESIIGRLVEAIVGILILVVSALFVLYTLDLPPAARNAVLRLETAITVVFLVEYLIRWWAKGFSFRYLLTPMAIIDLIAIVPLFLGRHLQLVRLVRFVRILRLLRLVQSRKFFFGEVTPEHLIVLRIIFSVFCIVFVTGGAIYELEHERYPEAWPNLFEAIYFAVVTLTTVGFGDITPHTTAGKVVTMIMILAGVLVIPWQLTTLAKRMLAGSGKVQTTCPQCGHIGHDPDASHCKSCGSVIFQPYHDES